MELKIRYREARFEGSIPALFIKKINEGFDSSREINLNLSFLDEFFRENEKDLENCIVIICPKVELNEELFNFINTKFYNVVRKCNMELDIISFSISRIYYAHEFVEKCKNHGIKFKNYYID